MLLIMCESGVLKNGKLTLLHTPKLFVQNIPQNTCKWHFNYIYLHCIR